MNKITDEEILSFVKENIELSRKSDNSIFLSWLNCDLIGDHVGDHKGNHVGDHVGYHKGDHVGNHLGDHAGYHVRNIEVSK